MTTAARVFLLAVVCVLFAGASGYSSGYRSGVSHERNHQLELRSYVNTKMEDLGFCKGASE
jgi:hypothetical protein